MKILCVCPIGIGNYLLCYPAFSALKKNLPDARLHLLALRDGVGRMAQGDPLWSGVSVLDPTKTGKDLGRPAALIAALRAEKFSASLNFFPSNTWQYHLLPWLAGATLRYGFRYHVRPLSYLPFLCNRTVGVDASLHDVRQNYRLTGYFLQKDISNEPPVFPVLFGEEDRQWARGYFASISSVSARIALHPGSSAEHGMDAKRWPPERFANLADRACRLLGAEAYIFGGEEESAVKKAVTGYMREKSHIVEAAPLDRTAALLSLCSLFLCNDSGLMHLAACMGAPTAAIFGPTDEKRNGPFGPRTLVIRKNMAGFPVWTAANVGDRGLPPGVDPAASLLALSVDEAWEQLAPWLDNIANT